MKKMFVQRTKVLQISLLAIFSAFIVEIVFGLISNSLALVTDSIHALLDSVVTVVSTGWLQEWQSNHQMQNIPMDMEKLNH